MRTGLRHPADPLLGYNPWKSFCCRFAADAAVRNNQLNL